MNLDKLAKSDFYFGVAQETGGAIFLSILLYFFVISIASYSVNYYLRKKSKKSFKALGAKMMISSNLNVIFILSVISLFFMFFSYQEVIAYRLSMRVFYILPLISTIFLLIWSLVSLKFNLQKFVEKAKKEVERKAYLKGKRR